MMTGLVVTIEPNGLGQYQLTIGDWKSAWSWNVEGLQALAFEVLTDLSGDKYHLVSGTAKLSLDQPRNRPYSTSVKDYGIAAHTTSVEEASV